MAGFAFRTKAALVTLFRIFILVAADTGGREFIEDTRPLVTVVTARFLVAVAQREFGILSMQENTRLESALVMTAVALFAVAALVSAFPVIFGVTAVAVMRQLQIGLAGRMAGFTARRCVLSAQHEACIPGMVKTGFFPGSLRMA